MNHDIDLEPMMDTERKKTPRLIFVGDPPDELLEAMADGGDRR